MYHPIQVPSILSKSYKSYVKYKELDIPSLKDFAIYAFEASSKTNKPILLREVILKQGTIDIGFDLDNKWIGFGGIKRTEYEFYWSCPFRNFGIRLKPGAFYQLTGLSAAVVMDNYIPLKDIDSNFDEKAFFQLSFDEAKQFVIDYIEKLSIDKEPNQYTKLFDQLADEPPVSTTEIYNLLNLSARQCQRNFNKHFGLSPKEVLTILRFQKCLYLLTKANNKTNEVMDQLEYYDQAHFTKDFKRNIGLTPRELTERYRNK
jgi:AraC-like DNA-binding protein